MSFLFLLERRFALGDGGFAELRRRDAGQFSIFIDECA